MAIQEDSEPDCTDDSSACSQRLEDDWEDLEPDVEDVSFKSLLDDAIFQDVRSMLDHCKDKYAFDFVKIQKDLGLDFLDSVKLVNYIRSVVKAGTQAPIVTTREAFQDSTYLQPVLEDDALLYSLEDLGEREEIEHSPEARVAVLGEAARPFDLEANTSILKEVELIKIRSLIDKVTQNRQAAQEPSDRSGVNMDQDVDKAIGSDGNISGTNQIDEDTHYYASYGYNDIHEIMLKDTVRTDAYRDFIYDNKHVVAGKLVLDVGCGTGILSMFCARAGAKKVYAVDKSNIIQKARENVFENGLQDTITCISGAIEEVTLPTANVDIIVSEWMGYCLLYEAMLDSVLWARDRYLVSGGLMIPSHATLRIAPIHDPDYIMNSISFWKSVYGFSMSSMTAHIYDDILVRDLDPETVVGDSKPFLHLPLHHSEKSDLTFTGNPFFMELNKDIDSLDGFVIWFDIFFATSPDTNIPKSASAKEWAVAKDGVAFTTGPEGEHTHWSQGVLLIDRGKSVAEALKKGHRIEGAVGYQKRKGNSRELDIAVTWEVTEGTADSAGPGEEVELGSEKGKQVWFMR